MKHPQAKLDPKLQGLINKAINYGYDVESLCHAIIGCSLTPYNMSDNERGQRYDGLHIIFRDADQIDRFIYNYHHPPKPIRNIDKRTQSNINAIQNWVHKKLAEEDNNA